MSADDLALVLDSAMPRKGRRASRGIPEVLKDLTACLKGADIDFVIAGALSLSLYAPGRYTKDIDTLVLHSNRKKLENALFDSKFRLVQRLPDQYEAIDTASGVTIDFLLGQVDPEFSAVHDPEYTTLLSVNTCVIKPEYLLWMYCLSDLRKHEVDALSMLKQKSVNLPLLEKYMKLKHDTTALKRLNALKFLAHRESKSTYKAAR